MKFTTVSPVSNEFVVTELFRKLLAFCKQFHHAIKLVNVMISFYDFFVVFLELLCILDFLEHLVLPFKSASMS